MILKEYQNRKAIKYPYHKSDIKWSMGIVVRYPFYGFFGGVMAGLLGIGGGLILGPLLLDLGLHPMVSTATSNFLVLFTSSSTSVQFILHGMMNFKYGFVCTICSTVGSYIGTVAIQRLVESTGRASMLIFTLAIVLAASTVFIPTYTFIQILDNGKDIWKTGSPC